MTTIAYINVNYVVILYHASDVSYVKMRVSLQLLINVVLSQMMQKS